MHNNTIDTIMKRYSCRAFTDKMPTDDQLKTIGEAALASPSGMNRQHWRIIVVKNRTLMDEMESEGMRVLAALPDQSIHERIMARGGKLFYNAPCMIVVPVKEARPSGAEQFDCGIVTQNIALAATSLGINSLICGLAAFSFAGDKADHFKAQLGFPEGYEIGIIVLLGYAEQDGKPHELDMDKLSFVE